MTELPQTTKIWICGEPLKDIGTRRIGDGARSFNQRVVSAKSHRARQQPEALLRELLEALATKKELAETQERLANLERALLSSYS